MNKILLSIALIYSVNSNAQTTTNEDGNWGKTVSIKKASKSIFSNSIFVKGNIGLTSAHVDEWENTTYSSTSDGSSSLGGGSWFPAETSEHHTYNSTKRAFTTLIFKIGNKWTHGSNEKWRPGIHFTWFKYTAFIPVNGGDFKRSLSFLMIGPNCTFKLSDNSAIELNTDFGLSFIKTNIKGGYESSAKSIGLTYDFELNYRYKAFTFGVDYSSILRRRLTTDPSSLNTLSLSFGIQI